MKSSSYIYIITNETNSVLYIGVTTDLPKRIYEHRNKLVDGFSAKYHLYKLIYFEVFDNIESALNREKQLKRWHREWKNNLISTNNPKWNDLYDEIRS